MIAELGRKIDSQLSRLEEELTERIPLQLGVEQSPAAYAALLDRQRAVQERIQYLKRIAAGLALVDSAALLPGRVGFGTVARVEDLDTGELMAYTIMNGEALDLDAGEISIGSPVAQALLGGRRGEVVEVAAPQRRRKLRILSLTTVFEMAGARDEASSAAAIGGNESPQRSQPVIT